MRKLLPFALLFFCEYAGAQSIPNTRQNAASFYYFPQFTNGKVVFKTGRATEAQLNYNLALEEMHFLNAKGDTLALANEETIQVIVIGDDSFYYNKGYLKVIGVHNNLKLVSKQKRSDEAKKQRGAYGENITGSAIDNFTTYQSPGKASVKLDAKEGTYGNFEVSYFIMDTNNNIVPAIRKNFLKYFPKYKLEIETFITSNALDFSVENDLKKLFHYANSLNNL